MLRPALTRSLGTGLALGIAILLAFVAAAADSEWAPKLWWLSYPLLAVVLSRWLGHWPGGQGLHGAAERLLLCAAIMLAGGWLVHWLQTLLMPRSLLGTELFDVLLLATVAVVLVLAQWLIWPCFGLLLSSRLPPQQDPPESLVRRMQDRAHELTREREAYWRSGLWVALAQLLLWALPGVIERQTSGSQRLLVGGLAYVLVVLPLLWLILALVARERRRSNAGPASPVGTRSDLPSFLLDGGPTPDVPEPIAPLPVAPLPEPVQRSPDAELIDAAQRGDLTAAKAALGHGAGANARPRPEQADQRTPMLAAATLPDTQLLRALIAAGGDVNGSVNGVTPLLAATRESYQGRVEAVMMLLANGADPTRSDEAGNTPLHHAAFTRDAGVAQSLIDGGASLNVVNREGMTPLALAAEAANWPLVEFLLKRGAQADVAEATPALLFAAAVDGDDVRGVKLLLKAKAKVLARGPHGRSALNVAALADNAEIAEVLLNAGADIEAADEHGMTPLLDAARAGAKRVLQRLVFRKPKADHADHRGRTALHWAVAAEQADAELLDILLTLDCPRHDQDVDGLRAVDLAARAGRWPLVRVLDPDYAIPAAFEPDEDAAGETPLGGQVGFEAPGRLLVRAATQGRFPLLNEMLKLPGVSAHDQLEAYLAALAHQDRRYLDTLLDHGLDPYAATGEASLWERLCALRPLPALGIEAIVERAERGRLSAKPLLAGLMSVLTDNNDRGTFERLCERALVAGADANACDSHGVPVLHLAAALQSPLWVARLIDAGADANARDPAAFGALHALVHAQRAEARELAPVLIRAGADPAAAARDGSTAYGLALSTAQWELASLLDWSPGTHPRRPLAPRDVAAAGRRGDLAGVDRLLSLGLPIDGVDERGATALLHAAGAGRTELVRELIARGADPLATAPNGANALSAAIVAGRQDVLAYLLDRGLSVDRPIAGGLLPLTLAAACQREAIVDMLLQRGARADGEGDGHQTPLRATLLAVIEREGPLDATLRIADNLLKHGARPDLPDAEGRSLLHGLLGAGLSEPLSRDENRIGAAVRLLASHQANLNALDRDLRTALHWACRHAFVSLAGLLLELGADPTLPDAERKLPVDLLTPRTRIHLGPLLRQAAEAWQRQRGK